MSSFKKISNVFFLYLGRQSSLVSLTGFCQYSVISVLGGLPLWVDVKGLDILKVHQDASRADGVEVLPRLSADHPAFEQKHGMHGDSSGA